jgi:TonB family protein
MFRTLLSSNAAVFPPAPPTAVAAVLHLIIVFLAVRLTQSQPLTTLPAPRDTIRLQIGRPPAVERVPGGVPTLHLPPAASLLPTLPVVPPIDHSFTSKQSGGIESIRSELVGKRAGMNQSRPEQSVFSDADVDQLPEIRGTLSPEYPEHLRRAGIGGQVMLEYVVLPTGRADSASIRVIASTEPAFTRSVIKAVLGAGFRPARRSGATVAVLVRQTIRFRNR